MNAKGVAIVNLFSYSPKKQSARLLTLARQITAANLIMCTVRVWLRKHRLNSIRMFVASGLIAINLDEGDELKWIRMTNGDNEVVISTAQGQAIRFHEKDAQANGASQPWCYVVFGLRPMTGYWHGYC